MIANIRKGLDHILVNAPQLPEKDRWGALVRYIVNKIIEAKPKNTETPGLAPPCLASGMG